MPCAKTETNAKTQALRALLHTEIKTKGALTIADYMQLCLNHSAYGYYHTRMPFGAKGDFITAPEISQMFGEMVALWCIDAWQKAGCPNACHIIELGPGRGVLCADVLYNIHKLAAVSGWNVAQGTKVCLVDSSNALEAEQKHTIDKLRGRMDVPPVAWYKRIDDIPQHTCSFIIANEFFDALPVHQFVVRQGIGYERVVAMDAQGDLCFTEQACALPAIVAKRVDSGCCYRGIVPPPNSKAAPTCAPIYEYNPQAEAIVAALDARLAQHVGARGAALVIDYGAWGGVGDTLQSVYKHTPCSPLARPGAVDITAHVNFAALATAVHRARYTILEPQGAWLRTMGMPARARKLGLVLKSAQTKKQHWSGYKRLLSWRLMGGVFKVWCVYNGLNAAPAGFSLY